MAEFAANAAQGHIGRAKYLATNEEARKTREKILDIPFTVKDLASAFEAANTLVELAKSQALAESEVRDEAELAKLRESYGASGSKLATGGSKAVKELEKEQKTRNVRMIRDTLDSALLDIATLYRNIFISKFNYRNICINEDLQNSNNIQLSKIPKEEIVKTIQLILEARNNLHQNSSSSLTIEALLTNVG
jgi:DNA polymerase-3 subunit delta'